MDNMPNIPPVLFVAADETPRALTRRSPSLHTCVPLEEGARMTNKGQEGSLRRGQGRGLRCESPQGDLTPAQAGQGRARRKGVPARPVSQSHGERQVDTSKSGLAPSRRRTSDCRRKFVLISLQSTFDELDDWESAPTRSHSSSFDQRRRRETLRTAIAMAFFCPTRTTRRLPRVRPV